MRSGKAVLALGILSATACVYEPTTGTRLRSVYDVVEFRGFVVTPGATVIVEARNQQTGSFEQIAATRAGQKAAILRGVTPLFAWYAAAPIASASLPGTACRWSKSCRIDDDPGATVRVRVPGSVVAPTVLYTFEAETLPCIAEKFRTKETKDYAAAYMGCFSPRTPPDSIRLGILP